MSTEPAEFATTAADALMSDILAGDLGPAEYVRDQIIAIETEAAEVATRRADHWRGNHDAQVRLKQDIHRMLLTVRSALADLTAVPSSPTVRAHAQAVLDDMKSGSVVAESVDAFIRDELPSLMEIALAHLESEICGLIAVKVAELRKG